MGSSRVSEDLSSPPRPFWRDQEEIVITGVSGRFPRCENVQEFGDLLMNGEDLVTEDDLRWPPGLFDLPKRHGKLKDLKKFDAQFFGVTPKQANFMDPQIRILLEVSYEAMIDAGINPVELRGTKTGVFVGCSASETGGALTQDPDQVTGYTLTGCVRSMFSNRLSYAFDLRGPSFSVDTACSSSLLALQLAIDAIRFDQSGDGYCRTEAVSAIIVQRKSVARRIYASVVHAKSNTDGYKEQGITFPLGERQAVLLEEIYREANVDPNSVYYVESHGTGTKVGDPQEPLLFRTQPLLIGSVKSNMGHAEPASGLCSIAKVIVAIQRGRIPPNLHFNEPNEYIEGLKDGSLKVVTEPTTFVPGSYIGVNSFGFGGSNTHVLLKAPEADREIEPIGKLPFPKLILYSGRTKECVENVMSYVHSNTEDYHLQQLLSYQAFIPSKDTPFRGYLILPDKNIEGGSKFEPDIQKVPITEPRPIWFIYSGMGSQWPGMAQKLMEIPAFDRSIRECSSILLEFGIDVYKLLQSSAKEQYEKNTLNCMLAITAIQIALTDLLELMQIVPDGILGHSTGEMGCGYADGALTKEQTMKLAYHRGNTIMKSKYNMNGAMAAVGLTWDETKKRCPVGVVPACHNGQDSVTISGDADQVKKLCEQLKEEGIFAKEVDTSGIPFHSPKMLHLKESMLEAMRTAIPKPKMRSSKWVSTSIPEDQLEEDLALYCSADYHVNNACSSVLFYEALQKIPLDAITIEIAPHCLMQSIIRRNLPKTCSNIGLMNNKAEDEMKSFLQALGRIYQAGASIHVENLYPVLPALPVPLKTPMIAPWWRWDHQQDWPVVDGRLAGRMAGGSVPSSASYTIDPFATDSKDAYLLDHVIDGRVLYPFTGYMILAWKTLCKLNALDFQKTPVILEDINVFSATILSKPIRLDVIITPGNGNFEILEGQQLAANGRIYFPDENRPFYYSDLDKIKTSYLAERTELDTDDAYKEFILRGYEYGQSFRGIYRACNSGEKGTLYWTGNWVTFLDSLLQTALLAERADTLRLPTRIRYLRIDPNKHLKSIEERDGIQLIELRNDIATNGCIAGGVECCELVAQTVPRRSQPAGQLYLEKIYFVKHIDNNALNDFPKERETLRGYRDILLHVLGEGLKKWEKLGILDQIINGEQFYKALDIINEKHKHRTFTAEATQKFQQDSRCLLLKAFEEIFQIAYDAKTPKEFERSVITKMKSAYKSLDTDRYWASASYNDRFLKSAEDICIENSASHKNKGCAIELSSTEVLKQAIVGSISHPLLEIEWTCVGNDVNDLDETTTDQLHAKKVKLDLNCKESELKLSNEMKNFDFLMLDRVLSKKSHPVDFLKNCAQLLRDDGLAIVIEPTKDHEISLMVDALQDFDLNQIEANNISRIYGVYFDQKTLERVIKEAEFRIVYQQTDSVMPTTTYVIRKIPKQKREPFMVDVDDVNEFSWIEPLQKIIEERLNEPDYKTIWLTSTKVRNNGTVGLSLCFVEENLKFNRFRTLADISLERENREGPSKIDLNNPEIQDMISLDLHANNYRDGVWGSLRHCVVKDEEMHTHKDVEHAFINTLVRGDISSLTWVESGNQYIEQMCIEQRKPLQLCYVYYAALNFRDVMLASGRLAPDAIPGQFADRECLLGMEFAGRLKDGSRVMGILPAQALATTVVCDMEYAWKVPEGWSLEDAATVPVAYSTAYYALVIRGRMRRGDKVLIHGGTGGVGQAAITIAFDYGCEVFTTVSTQEKQDFLREKFPQLNERHFANSRTADFEQHIRRVTNGRGVDIVLNSLFGDMLQASVRCLAQNGRFLEIGKMDLSLNSNLGMAVFLKNVTFHGILLDGIMDPTVGNKFDWAECANLLQDGIKRGVVKPLNYKIFPSNKAEEAFRYMSAGKHIGKVLIEIRRDEGQIICPPSKMTVKAVCRTLCDPHQVYLITGGLGGFGIELAQWLINRGARKLVLTSRKGIRTGYQSRCIHLWRRMGVSIDVSTLNIFKKDDSIELIRTCLNMGPLGGVFHLAMVLRDCLFENQTIQNFKDAAEAKYFGTINLDEATRRNCDQLRWFVVFSSITAGRGNGGQTNYGWSNSTMERIVEQRRKDGYPGMAIQWGAIGDVGIILESMGDNNTVVGGTLPQRMPSCLSCLDLFLSWNHPVVSSYIKADTSGKKQTGGGNLLQTIAHILGVNDVSQLNPDANLGDLGLDSLMGVEIKQALERDHDITLSMKEIRTLTLNNLIKMAENGGQTATTLKQDGEFDVKKEGEREAMLNTLEVLEQQMGQLFKLRVNVNDMDPEEQIIKCNKTTEGPITFFIHPIEGIASPLAKVTSKCEFPAYCLQFTRKTPNDSIESVAAAYIKEMKKIQPEGPYRIVGYSYGACIGFEIATQMQDTDGVGSIEKLILLDGSHLYMQTYRNVYRMAFGVTGDTLVNNPLFEAEILCAMTLRFANVDYKKFRVEMLQKSGFKERVQMVVDTTMKTGFFKNPETVAFACEAIRSKFLMADKYKPKHVFKGHIHLIRAEQGAAREEDVGADYGIGKVSDISSVHVVSGDHDSIVQGKKHEATADIINAIILNKPIPTQTPNKETTSKRKSKK